MLRRPLQQQQFAESPVAGSASDPPVLANLTKNCDRLSSSPVWLAQAVYQHHPPWSCLLLLGAGRPNDDELNVGLSWVTPVIRSTVLVVGAQSSARQLFTKAGSLHTFRSSRALRIAPSAGSRYGRRGERLNPWGIYGANSKARVLPCSGAGREYRQHKKDKQNIDGSAWCWRRGKSLTDAWSPSQKAHDAPAK